MRNSYLRINKARGIVRLPQIVIVEAHPIGIGTPHRGTKHARIGLGTRGLT